MGCSEFDWRLGLFKKFTKWIIIVAVIGFILLMIAMG
jgi:hypothetical protein